MKTFSEFVKESIKTPPSLRDQVVGKGKKIGSDPFGMGTSYMSHEGNIYAVHQDGKLSNHGPENEFRDKVKNGNLKAKLTA